MHVSSDAFGRSKSTFQLGLFGAYSRAASQWHENWVRIEGVSDAGDQLVITSFQAAHRAAAGAKYLPYAHRSSRPHYKHVGFVLVDRHRLIADPSPIPVR